MLLTVEETRIIMSVIEKKEISLRHVYYLTEMSRLIPIKVRDSIRIDVQEVIEFYDEPAYKETITTIALYLERRRSGAIFQSEQVDGLSDDLRQTIDGLQSARGRGCVEYSKGSPPQIHRRKLNPLQQLEFNFVA